MHNESIAADTQTINVALTSDKATNAALESDLEGLIMKAAGGDRLAKSVLRDTILRIARASLVSVDDAKSVTVEVLKRMRPGFGTVGRPRPGNAIRWLSNVVHAFANHAFEAASAEQWDEWDPPEEMVEEKPGKRGGDRSDTVDGDE